VNAAHAAHLAEGGTRQGIDPLAIGFFLAFVLVTLFITGKAATRTKSRNAFDTACGDITALQNGCAMTGDFTPAVASFGLTALMTPSGFDGMIYAIGFVIGGPLLLFLIAEPLRALRRYSFCDVLASQSRVGVTDITFT
jgi:cation/acetate symporter